MAKKTNKPNIEELRKSLGKHISDSEDIFLPIDLINYIYGDNPNGRIYYGTDASSFAELVCYFNEEPHKRYLSRTDITIQDKMYYIFGELWDESPEAYKRIMTARKAREAFEKEHEEKRILRENASAIKDMMKDNTSIIPEGVPFLPEVYGESEFERNKKTLAQISDIKKKYSESKDNTNEPLSREEKILNEYENAMREINQPPATDGTHLSTPAEQYYEMVNHPSHYNNYDKEVIDMMVDIWGKENTALWCKLTAFKYRMRMGTKPDNSIEQDLKKEQWYLNKAKELLQK